MNWLTSSVSGGLLGALAIVALAASKGLAADPIKAGAAQSAAAGSAEQVAFFEARIRPVLAAKCFSCHGDHDQRGGLRLDNLAAALKGGAKGPVIVAGDPDKSRLVAAVQYHGALKMPPAGKLRAEEISALSAWVKMGAPWPAVAPVIGGGAKGQALDMKLTNAQRNFWSFRPVTKPSLPAVKNSKWCISPVDRFVLAKLEFNGLKPAPPADRRSLIRRVSFDLVGLPPTPEEVEAFVNDRTPNAWEKIVDRLLASPHYGERWGRHWLDVVRYADSNGLDENVAFANAYHYRDYVVKAFNQDKPYNEFICEQLAGDLMPTETEEIRNDRITATGFLALGPKLLAEPDKPKMVMDIVDEQIEVTSKAFIGLTVTCARCHNHKFDPIPTKDYYALAGIFKSTKTMASLNTVAMWQERPLQSKRTEGETAVFQAQIKQAQANLDHAKEKANAELLADSRANAAKYLQAAWELAQQGKATSAAEVPAAPSAPQARTANQIAAQYGINAAILRHVAQFVSDVRQNPSMLAAPDLATAVRRFADRISLPDNPEPLYTDSEKKPVAKAQKALTDLRDNEAKPPTVMAVEDTKAENCRVHIRGDTQNLGDEVPRHFLTVLGGDKIVVTDDKRSGRLELAQWIARSEHPLTGRVEVNRIWQGHFGSGLVQTPDNWGFLGLRPTHPELLDWLASTFIEQSWSIKKLHRLILTSNTYKMGAIADAKTEEVASKSDPDNTLLWKMPHRRLEAEPFRDALLFVSGRLDLTIGGTLLRTRNHDYVTNDQSGNGANYNAPRRSLYLPIIRNALYDMFQAFDYGDPSMVNVKRSTTTVAPQALFLMNSPFVIEQARYFAESLRGQGQLQDTDRIRAAYQRAFGRRPSSAETRKALSYIVAYSGRLPASIADSAKRTELAWTSFCQVLLASNEFIYVN